MSSLRKNFTKRSSWSKCQPGTIEEVIEKRARFSRRQWLNSVGSTAGLLLLSGAGAFYLWRQNQTREAVRPIPCHSVIDYMGAYHDKELARALAMQLRAHLAVCAPCRKLYQTTYPNRVNISATS